MLAPLDELYLEWLYGQIGAVSLKNPSRTYWKLFRKLYSIEFVWLIPNDDNRVEDGLELRRRFVETLDCEVDEGWIGLGCSFLEMLIALSDRCAFESLQDKEAWFWEFLENLGLRGSNDKNPISDEEIENIANVVTWRTYPADGQGGLFPIPNVNDDLREIELWYQMSMYIDHYNLLD